MKFVHRSKDVVRFYLINFTYRYGVLLCITIIIIIISAITLPNYYWFLAFFFTLSDLYHAGSFLFINEFTIITIV